MFEWLFGKKKKQKKSEDNSSLEYGTVTLQDLINLRDAFYQDATRQIFKSLENSVLAATKNVLDEDTSRNTEWVSVEIVPPDHIAMLGVCTYPLGSVVSDGGIEISIDKENQEEYKRLIKLGMPLELAEKGTVEELVQYMKEHTDGSLPLKDNQPKVTASDFSVDSLTPEQQEQLKHFSQHSKDKVN